MLVYAFWRDFYLEYLHHSFSKPNDIHGHGHGVGERKDQTDGAAELRTQTAGNEVIRST